MGVQVDTENEKEARARLCNMTDLFMLIAAIEKAGFDWAVGRDGDHGYAATIELHPSHYIGDSMSGPGCSYGATPYEALCASAAQEGLVQE